MLGQALELEFGVDLTIGPSLEEGFYYDCFMGDKVGCARSVAAARPPLAGRARPPCAPLCVTHEGAHAHIGGLAQPRARPELRAACSVLQLSTRLSALPGTRDPPAPKLTRAASACSVQHPGGGLPRAHR